MLANTLRLNSAARARLQNVDWMMWVLVLAGLVWFVDALIFAVGRLV